MSDGIVSALSLNMMSRNLILTAIHGPKTRASQLAIYCNSSDRCIVCRHARRSECWVTSLYVSYLIWNRPWQQAAGPRLVGKPNLHRRFVFLAWLTTCYSRCWSYFFFRPLTNAWRLVNVLLKTFWICTKCTPHILKSDRLRYAFIGIRRTRFERMASCYNLRWSCYSLYWHRRESVTMVG